jgi:hypothetical protein
MTRGRFIFLILLVVIALFLTVDPGFGLRTDLFNVPFFGSKQDSGQVIDTKESLELITDQGVEISDNKQIANPEEKVVLPAPLVAPDEANVSALTVSGVIFWTNFQRITNGIGALKENTTLDKIASRKLQDMFSRQYFAHVSPSGDSVSDVADLFGYEYLMIGENLALGNFKSDMDLVSAWMESPGHRENILNRNYSDIGIAVGEGEFEGRTVWISVQVFALPLSACPEVNSSLGQDINDMKISLKALEAKIIDLRGEIESMYPKSGELYVDKINQYNSMVGEYNNLAKEIKAFINTYNIQVEVYNSCISALGV